MSDLDYATLVDVKDRMGVTGTDRDDELTGKITVASRRIDRDTGRRFYLDASANARVLGAAGRLVWTDDGEKLLVPDIGSETITVEVGVGSTWTTVDSSLWEAGGYRPFDDGWAIEWITMIGGAWNVPSGERVRITTQWGWPAKPAPIGEACLLLTQRLARRKDSPEGVASYAEGAVMRVSRYDPDYDAFIGAYVLEGA